jgi:hypothetical protein
MVRFDGKISKIRGRKKPDDGKLSCMALKEGENTLLAITTVIVTSSKFCLSRNGCWYWMDGLSTLKWYNQSFWIIC